MAAWTDYDERDRRREELYERWDAPESDEERAQREREEADRWNRNANVREKA